MPTPTTTIFGTFATTQTAGTKVTVQVKLLEDAASGALGVRNTYGGTMRVFNLAQTYGYKYDFHLSFKLDNTSQWAEATTHLCARDEATGHNACAYWFYDLVQMGGTGKLAWSFQGSAPDNSLYRSFMESIAISTSATSLTDQQMRRRRATAPLEKLLAKFDSLITQGRAVIVTDRHGRKLQYTK